ncbi:MAG: dprA protein, partial [Caulobacteraceae bacterium]|nr:dprA protein [Caulobacteraceae bacterium]
DPRAKGTNDLIRQGAAICEGADDVLRALDGISQLGEGDGPGFRSDLSPPEAEDDDAVLCERVAALLSPTPVSRDELIHALSAPAPTVLAALVELALAQRAELLPGGMVASR